MAKKSRKASRANAMRMERVLLDGLVKEDDTAKERMAIMKSAMDKKGLNFHTLAKKVGITFDWLMAFASGKTNVHPHVAKKIADTLGLKVEQIMRMPEKSVDSLIDEVGREMSESHKAAQAESALTSAENSDAAAEKDAEPLAEEASGEEPSDAYESMIVVVDEEDANAAQVEEDVPESGSSSVSDKNPQDPVSVVLPFADNDPAHPVCEDVDAEPARAAGSEPTPPESPSVEEPMPSVAAADGIASECKEMSVEAPAELEVPAQTEVPEEIEVLTPKEELLAEERPLVVASSDARPSESLYVPTNKEIKALLTLCTDAGLARVYQDIWKILQDPTCRKGGAF